MSKIGFYSRILTRDIGENLHRLIDVHTRYGSHGLVMIHRIIRLVKLLNHLNVRPTFPTPAVILLKYPQFFEHLVQEYEVELAVHGYRHVDYTMLSTDEVEQELEKAYSIFHSFRISLCGFRFPFLKKNSFSIEKLGKIGYAWDSSVARYWDVVPWDQVGERKKLAFHRILSTYQAIPAEKAINLPYWIGQTLEIPVSLPDDDMLLDRMRIRDPRFLLNVWSQILKQVRARRGIFVLQAHPERSDFFYIPLSQLLHEAKAYGDVWIASLGEVAKWWRERFHAQFKFEQFKRGQWKVIASHSNRFTLYFALNDTLSEIPVESRQNRVWLVECLKRPCIGVHPETAFPVLHWLRQEGILFEITPDNSQHEIFIHEPNPNLSFSELSKRILTKNCCILKLGEWPAPFRSAFAVSGDIDYMDVWGFWSKLYAS